MPELWTEEDVARFLKLDANDVRKLRQAPDGPPFLKIRRNVRYVPGKVMAWCEARMQTSTRDG